MNDGVLRFDIARKAWADGFMPLVLEIIKSVLHRLVNVETAPLTDDVMGVDVYISIPQRWSIRLRRAKYFHKYCDLTFRITPNGCELDKVTANADFMFYGWLNEEETDLLGWVILDLAKLDAQGDITGVYTVPGGNALCSLPIQSAFKRGAIAAMSESVAQRIGALI